MPERLGAPAPHPAVPHAAAAPAPGAAPDEPPDAPLGELQDVLERGRRVYTAVVVVLQLLVVAAALAAASLEPGGGSPSVVVAAVLATAWLAVAAVHLVRGLPVPLLVLLGLLCAAALPPLVAGGTPAEAGGVLRVLPTTASAVLWLLAGTPGRVVPVLVRAVGTGAVALGVVSVSAALSGLGPVDVVGPLVTALLAVASLLVADRYATRAERALEVQRAAAVDLLVARDLAAARRRLDGRLHDVVLGALATMVTADAARAPAVRELAAEALALLVAAGPDAAADGVGRGPLRRTPSPGAHAATGGEPAGDGAAAALEAGVRRLADRAAEAGLLVEVRRGDGGDPGPAEPGRDAGRDAGRDPGRGTGAPTRDCALEALLGAVGECLRNVERHAGTSSALLVWSAGASSARALVVDAGAGFDPAAVPAGSLGLSHSVRGRLEDVGGGAHIRSRPGRGTLVQMAVPLPPARGGAPAAAGGPP